MKQSRLGLGLMHKAQSGLPTGKKRGLLSIMLKYWRMPNAQLPQAAAAGGDPANAKVVIANWGLCWGSLFALRGRGCMFETCNRKGG
jgi:hypothetical protein